MLRKLPTPPKRNNYAASQLHRPVSSYNAAAQQHLTTHQSDAPLVRSHKNREGTRARADRVARNSRAQTRVLVNERSVCHSSNATAQVHAAYSSAVFSAMDER